MPAEKGLAERVRRLVRRPPSVRKLVIVYDKRDAPPWTCELTVDGVLIAVRAGRTLQEAVTGVVEADRRQSQRRATRSRDALDC